MSQYIDRKSSVLQTSICESRFYVASDFATTLFRIIHASVVFVCVIHQSKLIKYNNIRTRKSIVRGTSYSV